MEITAYRRYLLGALGIALAIALLPFLFSWDDPTSIFFSGLSLLIFWSFSLGAGYWYVNRRAYQSIPMALSLVPSTQMEKMVVLFTVTTAFALIAPIAFGVIALLASTVMDVSESWEMIRSVWHMLDELQIPWLMSIGCLIVLWQVVGHLIYILMAMYHRRFLLSLLLGYVVSSAVSLIPRQMLVVRVLTSLDFTGDMTALLDLSGSIAFAAIYMLVALVGVLVLIWRRIGTHSV